MDTFISEGSETARQGVYVILKACLRHRNRSVA